jgi:hypothetical protein
LFPCTAGSKEGVFEERFIREIESEVNATVLPSPYRQWARRGSFSVAIKGTSASSLASVAT